MRSFGVMNQLYRSANIAKQPASCSKMHVIFIGYRYLLLSFCKHCFEQQIQTLRFRILCSF